MVYLFFVCFCYMMEFCISVFWLNIIIYVDCIEVDGYGVSFVDFLMGLLYIWSRMMKFVGLCWMGRLLIWVIWFVEDWWMGYNGNIDVVRIWCWWGDELGLVKDEWNVVDDNNDGSWEVW